MAAAAAFAAPEGVYKLQPALEPAQGLALNIDGYLRGRIDRAIARYFLETPESSPAILQVLRDRDKTPTRDPLVPWAGEFAGKFLTGAELTWRATHDSQLRAAIDAFARDFMACQAADGYLGPFRAADRLTGKNWDVWGHYHAIVGLLLYFEDTHDAAALECCKKAADLICATFGPGKPSLTCDGSGGQMNMAICHGLLLLYAKTHEQTYYDTARYVVDQAWNEPDAGHYLEAALAGKPVWEFPQHRWEALHDYQAMPQLYWMTGDESFRNAALDIWRSGLRGDRHNTGGVTSGEGFCGSPYNPGAIETCCTVAWIAFGIDVLRMTGDSTVADEIEWSTLNSALGAIPYSGRACAYNVPMDGTRAYGIELPWQAPKAGPDLNCCAVNAYRPLGAISQWALMTSSAPAIYLNFYGAGKLAATLPSGNALELAQETQYPAEGNIKIQLNLRRPETFTLNVRIPQWSRESTVRVNGEQRNGVKSGAYFAIEREWKSGDVIEIALDFKPRIWEGEKECAGKFSVYRGPILYAYDARFNDVNPEQLPPLDSATLRFEKIEANQSLPPWILMRISDSTGAGYAVCDFSSAGQTGNHYRSWLPKR
jgi:DUF1680 family protein